MGSGEIVIVGAREHNLKDISLTLPRDRFIVITGLSGSGKSSLAFDTIYAEGQRRYVESLSSYARQFLGQMNKPDVDSIEGLSPAISIDQKTTSRNPRSTVGTVTEIYDYLRLLYARIGHPHCWICGRPIEGQSKEQIVDQILGLEPGTRFVIKAPVVRGQKGWHKDVLEHIRQEGFTRVEIDGSEYLMDEALPDLDKNVRHDISVVVDRLVMKEGVRRRLSDSVETALSEAHGLLVVDVYEHGSAGGDESGKPTGLLFSENLACPIHGVSLPEMAPRIFSFNSPHGACDTCGGLGARREIDPALVVGDASLSVAEGVLLPWSGSNSKFYEQIIRAIAERYEVDVTAPWADLPQEVKDVFLTGTEGERLYVTYENRQGMKRSYMTTFEGIVPNLERRYRETDSEYIREKLEEYMSERPCPACHGARLKPATLAVRIGGLNIYELSLLPVAGAARFPGRARPQPEGEAHRGACSQGDQGAALVSRVGGRRLSEPLSQCRQSVRWRGTAHPPGHPNRFKSGRRSVHPGRAFHRSSPAGQSQADRHSSQTARPGQHGDRGRARRRDDAFRGLSSGHGPGGWGARGRDRGERLAGRESLRSLGRSPGSSSPATGASRSRRLVARARSEIVVKGAREHNLKNLDVRIPTGKFVCVTGVSGSGKSTLVNDIVFRSLSNLVNRVPVRPGDHDRIEGIEILDKVINIDQSPIGRTPRSNPATYTGLWDHIRELFSQTQEAKVRGYAPGRFSFNVKGGRCEACKGDGTLKIEMHFLPDVYVPCEVCQGKRYNRETLEVRFKGKNVAEILDMSVEEGVEFFVNQPKIRRRLQTLADVGLEYIKLGQPSTTLSGGEAQRVKLATELAKIATGNTLYILDEPTTGLHFADVDKLLEVLQRLVDSGNTVLVIEHNLDVIKCADWLIDLGPEGGDAGGELVAEGTPEEVCDNPAQ